MRLIHTNTLELKEFAVFADSEIPQYAILSHTWEEEEVSFQDWQKGLAKEKAGFKKILRCCEQAVKDSLRWAWVDTCCIDKSSSAELSEAINSMYRWYGNASICYTYLTDVVANENPKANDSTFAKSRWYTRGWTLQELIAPPQLVFYSHDWQLIGTKLDLKESISAITGVDVNVLADASLSQAHSIATRMSWASKRITTRKEDIAYCLMGLFDINMPLLYGEGANAFRRLQEEIARTSNDHSLFAWKCDKKSDENFETEIWGPLAVSPAYFAESSHIVPTKSNFEKTPYSITKQSISIELLLLPETDGMNVFPPLFVAVLECSDSRPTENPAPVGIYLKSASNPFSRYFIRVFPDKLVNVCRAGKGPEHKLESTKIFIAWKSLMLNSDNLGPAKSPQVKEYWFHIPTRSSGQDFALIKALPENNWNWQDEILRMPTCATGVAGALLFTLSHNKKHFIVTIGVNCNFNTVVRIETKYAMELDSAYSACCRLFELDSRNTSAHSIGPSRPSVCAFRAVESARIGSKSLAVRTTRTELFGRTAFEVSITVTGLLAASDTIET